MNIKEIVKYINEFTEKQLLNDEIIQTVKMQKKVLSKRDKEYLKKKLSDFRKYDTEYTLALIVTYSIWCPDEAIEESRKKGVFRYKAWGFKINSAEILLVNIKKFYKLFFYNEETKAFIEKKLKLSWLFDFYKKSESELIELIKHRHENRRKYRQGQSVVEETLFKELLAYADVTFYLNNRSNEFLNKNKLSGYGHEEIFDGISYIIYLYDEIIGIKDNIHYVVSDKYVLSDEIEQLILVACKVIQIQEWEICVDYFNYSVQINGRNILISDKDKLFEKSVRLGHIRREMQEQIFYKNNLEHTKKRKMLSLTKIGEDTKERLSEVLLKDLGNGILSRYRFEFPELIFEPFKNAQDKFFEEEVLSISYNAREMIMNNEEMFEKKITNNCTLNDIVLFQRFFLYLDVVASNILFNQKDKKKIIRSLIPHFRYENLIKVLTTFIGNRIKAEELLQLFTYQKDVKLDLQYTPFIKAAGGVFFSNSLVARSNLQRNCIAYSYLSKNQLVNQDDRETLVQECIQIFNENNQFYKPFPNRKFSFDGKQGEVDVLVISDNEIIIIECKLPLMPTNNFEMRASVEHVNKAVKQLDFAKKAFLNKEFRMKYLQGLGIKNNDREIRTCIVFGNRLFNGRSINGHPIRYIRELDMVLNIGHIYSNIQTWRIWEDEEFHPKELHYYLTSDHPLITSNFNSMEKTEEFMFVKGNKICFETYLYNPLDVFEEFNKNFLIRDIEKF